MRYLLAIITLLISLITVTAQQSRPRRTSTVSSDSIPPRLKTTLSPEYVDDTYLWGEESIHLRTGKEINIPLTDSPSLQLGLETPLSTKGMTGTTINRVLIVHGDILTMYGDKLAIKDSAVETRISGHKSGVKSRATLLVEPRTLELKLPSPIQIGTTKEGERIFLKPGTWLLRLHCTIQSIEADNIHWYPTNDNESITIRGKMFGGSSNQDAFADPYMDLQYINPFGAFAYSMTRIGKLAGILFHRPNINLPPATQLFFRIDRIEGTYLAPPLPTDTPRPVK
jgi:hypothetical protein